MLSLAIDLLFQGHTLWRSSGQRLVHAGKMALHGFSLLFRAYLCCLQHESVLGNR